MVQFERRILMTGLLGKLVEHFTADPFIGQEFEAAMQDDFACELSKFLHGIEASGSLFQVGLGNGISTIPPVWMLPTSALPNRNRLPPNILNSHEVGGTTSSNRFRVGSRATAAIRAERSLE